LFIGDKKENQTECIKDNNQRKGKNLGKESRFVSIQWKPQIKVEKN